ncbi:MAG: DUF4943 domain-containing protein [Bacteroides sp.]|nr:DUF4943 domain-containing protein [Bacteroides sp.]
MKKLILLLPVVLLLITACNREELNYHNPDVKLFIKQLKAGTYKTEGPNGYVSVPDFEVAHIEELLKYADDMTIVSKFPAPPVSRYSLTDYTLGEGILWTVETIRLGRWASLGCKLVRREATSYDRIFFLNEEELTEVVQIYRNWWENYRKALELLEGGKLSF